MSVVAVSVLYVVLNVVAAKEAADWGYINTKYVPSRWGELPGFEICKNGRRQSPLALWKRDAEVDPSLGDIKFSNYRNYEDKRLKMKHDGHTVRVDLESMNASISGAGLDGSYRLLQFHMHWGAEDTRGSEHIVNGKQYAAEIHFVHRSNRYSSADEAVLHQDGHAVIGILIEVDGGENPAFDRFESKLPTIQFADSPILDIDAFDLLSLYPEENQRANYFRYEGSLTTPPCSETVLWTVLEEHVKISARQMAIFRDLYVTSGDTLSSDSVRMIDLHRPMQKLYDREIRRSPGNGGATSGTPAGLIGSTVVLFVFASLLP